MDLKSSKLGMVKEAVILEGHRLIKDAVALGAKMKSLYFCEASALESLPKEYLQNVTLYKVTFKDMKVWADTTTPSGLLGRLILKKYIPLSNASCEPQERL